MVVRWLLARDWVLDGANGVAITATSPPSDATPLVISGLPRNNSITLLLPFSSDSTFQAQYNASETAGTGTCQRAGEVVDLGCNTTELGFRCVRLLQTVANGCV